jgi:Transcriptional regulator
MSSEEGTDTKTAIMEATYEVLARDGFERLTTERIAEACNRSQGVIHYHYETRQELLGSFIEYLLERRTETLTESDGDPSTRLARSLAALLPATLDSDRRRYTAVSLELHAQARHNEAYREKLARRDTRVQERLAEIVSDGIEAGQFNRVDADSFAFRLLTTVDGTMLRAVSLDDESTLRDGRDTLERAVRTELLDGDESWQLPGW